MGVRVDWWDAPFSVRDAVERWLGEKIAEAVTQPTGFSPGVAARLRTADGRRVFVKAVSAALNPDSPELHRREARIVAHLPEAAAVPRLLWSYDEGHDGWVALAFEDIEGRHPTEPWQMDELQRVLKALDGLGAALKPSPLPLAETRYATDHFREAIKGWQLLIDGEEEQLSKLDDWSRRHLLKLSELESKAPVAVRGETLLQFDVRGDNILLAPNRVWFVDWPHARVGAPWVDVVGFAPSVRMQGGPDPEVLIAMHPACREADPDAVTAAVASIAGYFTHGALQPPPPGIPTVRAFQAAQGVVAREWLARRTGWS